MLGPSKRNARSSVSPLTASHLQSLNLPPMPPMPNQNYEHLGANSMHSYNLQNQTKQHDSYQPKKHTIRKVLLRIKANFGIKCGFTFLVAIILLFCIWRAQQHSHHSTSTPSRTTRVLSSENSAAGEHLEGREAYEPLDADRLATDRRGPKEEETLVAGVFTPPPPPSTSLGPAVHEHPPAFDWPHEHTEEYRPSNFALNGEHPQFNEEKITSIFERPRVAGLETPGLVTSFLSPDGKLKVSILMSEEGKVGYMLDAAKPESLMHPPAVYVPVVGPSFTELNGNYKACTFRTDNSFGAEVVWQLEFGESWWRPVPGNERRYFHTPYQQAKVWCVGAQCQGCHFLWEFRLYDHALAVRAVVDGASVHAISHPHRPASAALEDSDYGRLDFGMEVKLPVLAKTTCWAQNAEDPYVKRSCAEWQESVPTPMTVHLEPLDPRNLPPQTKQPSLPIRYMAILQADGPAFTRSVARTAIGDNSTLQLLTRGEIPLKAFENQLGVIEHPVLGWSTPTSWNVILAAETTTDLVHRNHLVYMLCPPPSEKFPMSLDSRWVAHGKSLRVRGHSNKNARYLVDFASTYHYQLIHFDAGWYGPERNTSSDPRIVYPPYQQELNIHEVTKYAKARGVGVTVYVNEIGLSLMNELIEQYPKWELMGIKFGFANVDTPKQMRLLHQRLISMQHTGLSANVHDLYRPRGLTRTWPHIVTQEGVRGEERKPDATHHTILPFVRYVQGPADYTPRYLKGKIKCTPAHQLALPIVLFSPIQSLFWSEPGQAIMESVQLHTPELIVWQNIPTTWDDTRLMSGVIGEHAVMARRTGSDWFIGAITNVESRSLVLNLSSLFDHTIDKFTHPLPVLDPPPVETSKGYTVYLYADDLTIKIDDSKGPEENNKRTAKLRQTFILPAEFSTKIHYDTKELVTKSGIPNFPHDPVPSYAAHLQEYRRKINMMQERQLNAQFKKRTGEAMPPPTVLDSPMFKIQMAKSGGAVLFLAPIV